jgi:MYXO-CTERM domain-containing protein
MRVAGAAALLSAMVSYASRSEAQCSQCMASSETNSSTVTDAWGTGCVPGFVIADNNADGSASVSMTIGTNSLQFIQTIASSGCCVAPYANIGIFDACQSSDQYNQPGSHLPIQLKNIALLKGAWTFQVPYPLNPNWQVEQYRVYYEMFLSSTTAGHADSGNITIDFFNSNYGYDPPTGNAPINGPQGLNYNDLGIGGSQGPFVDFIYPTGVFTPDSHGVVTVDSTDVKAVLDWSLAKFPSYYNGDLYLSSLSLAVEAGAFQGSVKTSYASFAVQATGSPVVYTPPFTSTHWATCATATDCNDNNPCTTDSCTSSVCSNTPIPGCGDSGAPGGSSGSSSGSSSGGSSGASSGASSGGSSGGSSGSSSGGKDGGKNAGADSGTSGSSSGSASTSSGGGGGSGSGSSSGSAAHDGGSARLDASLAGDVTTGSANQEDPLVSTSSGCNCTLAPDGSQKTTAMGLGVGFLVLALARTRRRK